MVFRDRQTGDYPADSVTQSISGHSMTTAAAIPANPAPQERRAAFTVLAGLSFSHMVNDTAQSLLLAIYPMIKTGLQLSFAQIGMITLTYQITASILQPAVGRYTDKNPVPYSLPVGMGFTLCGLLLLAVANSFATVVIAAALVGIGSSIFHPESSRMARIASGGRHGMAQSVFQVGGNVGSAMGPLLAALVVAPLGRTSLAWIAPAAVLGMLALWYVSRWYSRHRRATRARTQTRSATPSLPRSVIVRTFGVLLLLLFSKYFYMASIGSFLTFYLIAKFGVSVKGAQLHLFLFMAAVAVGTLAGGPIGDRIGVRPVIWSSILGASPFALAVPYANLFWTSVLLVIIGLILASAFSAILVYAQGLIPSRVGMVSGLVFGFAFGMGGLGAGALGVLADHTSVDVVYRMCAFLPLLGVVALALPDVERKQ